MQIVARGWGKDHGEKEIAKRDLATAKVGRFDIYSRSETYITPRLPDVRRSALWRHRNSDQASVEVRLDAKIVLNGDYLLRVDLNREEVAHLFFLLCADCSLEDLMELWEHARSLQEDGPLPRLPFNPVMLKKVDELDLSVRSSNCLKNDNIVYVGDLVQRGEAELLRTPNFGRKSTTEIKEALRQMGLHFGMEVPGWRPDKIELLAKRFEKLSRGL